MEHLDFCKCVKTALKARKMTQRDLAERLGILPQQLYITLHGNPSLSTMQKIADAIGCSVGELIEPPHLCCPNCGAQFTLTLL